MGSKQHGTYAALVHSERPVRSRYTGLSPGAGGPNNNDYCRLRRAGYSGTGGDTKDYCEPGREACASGRVCSANRRAEMDTRVLLRPSPKTLTSPGPSFDYVSRLSWQIRFLPDLVTRNARAAASAPRCGGAAAARAAVLHAASAHDRCADVHVLVHCWSFVASCSACMCTRCTIVDHHRELQRSRHRRAESRRTGPCASGAGALLRARSRRPRCRPGAAAAEAANVSPPPPPSRPPPAPT